MAQVGGAHISARIGFQSGEYEVDETAGPVADGHDHDVTKTRVCGNVVPPDGVTVPAGHAGEVLDSGA